MASDAGPLPATGDDKADAVPTTLARYVYTALSSAKGHLRLLRIISAEQRLSFGLEEHSFADAPEYLALSYTWGTPVTGMNAETEALYLRQIEVSCDGRHFSIGRNLFEALSQLNENFPDAYFWADAICINQGDLQEQGHQVAQMGDVYANAAKVVVWLGLDTLYPEIGDVLWLQREDFRQHLFELEETCGDELPDLMKLNRFLVGVDYPPGMNPRTRWQAYETFYGRCRWWSRAWVVQEVVLAQEILMFCGKLELNWDKLRSLSNITRRHKAILEGLVESFSPNCVINMGRYGRAMYDLRSLCINGGPEAIDPTTENFVFGESRINKREGRLFAFIDYALSVVRPLNATKLQDKVYCIFGLINRFLPPWMEPSFADYNLSPPSAYFSMALMLVKHGPTLSVLSSAVGPAYEGGLRLRGISSWVPDYSVAELLPRRVKETPPRGKDALYPYRDAISFVEDNDGVHRFCQVAGGTLTLLGTLIDIVEDTAPLPANGLNWGSPEYMAALLRFCRHMKISHLRGESRLQAISRTLTLGRVDLEHPDNTAYSLSPIQWFLGFNHARARVSGMRTDGRKPMIEFRGGRMVENKTQKAMLQMGGDLGHLASTEPEDWWDVNKLQTLIAPALLEPSERAWLLTDNWAKTFLWEDHPYTESTRDLAALCGTAVLPFMIAIEETMTSTRTLFRTKRGYVGLGLPNLEVGDEVWALAGGAVPFCLRHDSQSDTKLLYGECYLHGFMNGWDCMQMEGLSDDLVPVHIK